MQATIDLIKRFEGLHKLGKDKRVRPYLDPVGIPTVGWGTIRFDQSRESFTIRECEMMLNNELKPYVSKILVMSPILRDHAVRLAAVSSWVYNLGIGAYKASTMKRKIDRGDWEAAASECMKWCNAGGRKLPGLVLRRAVEAAMIRTGSNT